VTRVLVIAEHDEAAPAPATLHVAGAARAMAPASLDVAVLAATGDTVAAAAARIGGVSRVRLIARAANAPCLAAAWAPQVAELARDYTHVLAAATTFGKDLIPRVAALCGVGALSDIVAIDGPHRFRRPVYAGNAILDIEADPAKLVVATVRPTAFAAPEPQAEAPVEPVALDVALPRHTRFVERRGEERRGPDLQTASTVVAGGRGLGGPAGVALIARLASCLDAAVGASRAAVDSGWMPNELQVGQTGKIVAPALYFGIGISGAIQHLTGIKDAGTVVAINKDGRAPICAVADIVLVADLFAAVPELVERLDRRRAK
jgi:electron transfer flavoprotein alpha subunit